MSTGRPPDGSNPDRCPSPRASRSAASFGRPVAASPFGLEFIGCRATLEGFMLPCPSCCTGWVPVLPDGTQFGYRLASEAGCSDGCDGPSVAWWHAWRMGELPPRAQPDERAKRYALGCIKRALVDIPDKPTLAQLKGAAFEIGSWLQAGGLDTGPAAHALLGAAKRAGLDDQAMVLASAVSAGRARPGRIPA